MVQYATLAEAQSAYQNAVKRGDLDEARSSRSYISAEAARRKQIKSSRDYQTVYNKLKQAESVLKTLKNNPPRTHEERKRWEEKRRKYTRIKRYAEEYLAKVESGEFKPTQSYSDAKVFYNIFYQDKKGSWVRRKASKLAYSDPRAKSVRRNIISERKRDYKISQQSGITKEEWVSMNAEAKRAVIREYSRGSLRRAGEPAPSPKGDLYAVTLGEKKVVGTREYVARKKAAYILTKRQEEAEYLRAQGFTSAGQLIPRRTRVVPARRADWESWDREQPFTLTTTNLELIAGRKAEVKNIRQRLVKKPGLLTPGARETIVDVSGASPAQSWLLSRHQTVLPLQELRIQEVIPSRAGGFVDDTNARARGLARGTIYEGVAVGIERLGTSIERKYSRKAEALPSKKEAFVRYNILGKRELYSREMNNERANAEYTANIGASLRVFGREMRQRPASIAATAGVTAAFSIFPGASAAIGFTRTAIMSRYVLGLSTAAYGGYVGYELSTLKSGRAKAELLGREAPYFLAATAGGIVGAKAGDLLVTTKKEVLARRVAGRPVTTKVKKDVVALARLETGRVLAPEEVMVDVTSLRGVKYSRSGFMDQFGYRSVAEFKPVFGETKTMKLSEVQRPDYYEARLRGVQSRRFFSSRGESVEFFKPGFERSRVVTRSVAERYAKPKVDVFRSEHVGSVKGGFRVDERGFIRFFNAKGGLGVYQPGALARDSPYYRDMYESRKILEMIQEMKIFAKPTRTTVDFARAGVEESRPVSFIGESRPKVKRGVSRSAWEDFMSVEGLPGYDTTIGGQRLRIVLEGETATPVPSGRAEPVDVPIIKDPFAKIGEMSRAPSGISGGLKPGLSTRSGRGFGLFGGFDVFSKGFGSTGVGDLIGSRAGQKFNPGQEFEGFFDTATVQTPKTGLDTLQSPVIKPLFDTTLTPTTTTAVTTKPTFDTPLSETPKTPPEEPPFTPFGGLPLQFFPGLGRPARPARSRGRGYRYAPSFTAAVLGITGRRGSKVATGFELRPLLAPKKKSKKRRKKR